VFIVKRDIPSYFDRDIVMGVYTTESMAIKNKKEFIQKFIKKLDYDVDLEKYIKIEEFTVKDINLLKTVYLVYFYEEGSRQIYIDILAILKTNEEAEKYIKEEKESKKLFWGWYKIESFEIQSNDA